MEEAKSRVYSSALTRRCCAAARETFPLCPSSPLLQVEEKLGRFPATFDMGADLRSLVEGMWNIDHNAHKVCVRGQPTLATVVVLLL